MIDEEFYTVLDGLTAQPVQQNTISEDKTGDPYVWFQRTSQNEEILLDGTPTGVIETTFTLEVTGTVISTAQSLADSLRTSLHGGGGPGVTWGSHSIRGIWVNDVSDDYIPRNVDADSGYHVAALQVLINHD